MTNNFDEDISINPNSCGDKTNTENKSNSSKDNNNLSDNSYILEHNKIIVKKEL